MTAARKPHIHAKEIHAFADGFIIQFRNPRDKTPTWVDFPPGTAPSWCNDVEYRVKSERVYPETRMNGAALFGVYTNSTGSSVECGLIAVARAVLHHAVDADQVVPMAEVQEVARNLNKAQHAKYVRDVASAVYLACHAAVSHYSGATANHMRQGVDINKILAKEPV